VTLSCNREGEIAFTCASNDCEENGAEGTTESSTAPDARLAI
jgi:hypothetical protein